MRLLVSCIPYDGGKSGLSVYAREVVRALHAQGHELTLLVEPPAGGSTGSQVRRFAGSQVPDIVSELSNFRTCEPANGLDGGCAVVQAPGWTRRPVLSMLWHLFFLPFRIRRRRKDFDGFAICAANRRVCAWYPLPTTATVHDLANFHIPGKYSRSRMFYLAHVMPFFAKRAQHLVAVSGATKADMVRFWHCKDEDVTVLYDGLTGSFASSQVCKFASSQVPPFRDSNSNMEPGTASVASLGTWNDERSESLNGVPAGAAAPAGAAILYISRIEHPGKNHVRLIEAYGTLSRDVAAAHPLVLAGADWKDAQAVHDAAARSPNAASIRFAGFVPDGAALEALWAQTGFYVFPSLFEGFGLSLAEAMARGVPCACSANGSLGEIGEGVAATFDPEDVSSIAAALRGLLAEDPAARARRVALGFERIKRFSWPDHAAGLVRLLGKGAAA